MSYSEMLEDAADAIEKHGWTQGAFFSGGRMCLMGALALGRYRRDGHDVSSESGFSLGIEGIGLPVHACGWVRKQLGQSIHTWNDTPGRTQQEVLDKMRELAKVARKEEEGIE